MSRKHGPIHYITQPNFQVGTGKMQKNFIAKKNRKSAAFDVNGQEMVQYFDSTHAHNHDRQTKNNQEERERLEDREEIQSSNHKKSFKEMNTEERIGFLLHRPLYISASPCEIKTTQQSYFGFIEKYDGTELVLRHLNKEELVSIARQEITEILLLRM